MHTTSTITISAACCHDDHYPDKLASRFPKGAASNRATFSRKCQHPRSVQVGHDQENSARLGRGASYHLPVTFPTPLLLSGRHLDAPAAVPTVQTYSSASPPPASSCQNAGPLPSHLTPPSSKHIGLTRRLLSTDSASQRQTASEASIL
ncbi:hypothetical protein O3P69_008947 [Scylla paramamosain]|uniref:Uncharacterized protein n=1 Tax=Scylla paramamosain TaxID=85552 RepID=A0AAW0TSK1_SCYPA